MGNLGSFETMSAAAQADLDEAKHLLEIAKRPFLKRKLEAIISEAEQALADAGSDAPIPAEAAAPVRIAATAAASPSGDKVEWAEGPSFAWDQGEHNSQWVSVYLMSGLEGVGEIKDDVSCDFSKDSFDLRIVGLHGKNYRLFKTNLDKEIDPDKSKIVVKKDKIKGQYGYEHWVDLVSKKSVEQKKKESDDPMSGIMDLMKNMYDEGDDDMKRTIGEAMM